MDPLGAVWLCAVSQSLSCIPRALRAVSKSFVSQSLSLSSALWAQRLAHKTLARLATPWQRDNTLCYSELRWVNKKKKKEKKERRCWNSVRQGDREIALQWVSGALLHTSHISHTTYTYTYTYTYTIDSIAVSTICRLVEFVKSEANPNNNLMMRRASLSNANTVLLHTSTTLRWIT